MTSVHPSLPSAFQTSHSAMKRSASSSLSPPLSSYPVKKNCRLNGEPAEGEEADTLFVRPFFDTNTGVAEFHLRWQPGTSSTDRQEPSSDFIGQAAENLRALFRLSLKVRSNTPPGTPENDWQYSTGFFAQGELERGKCVLRPGIPTVVIQVEDGNEDPRWASALPVPNNVPRVDIEYYRASDGTSHVRARYTPSTLDLRSWGEARDAGVSNLFADGFCDFEGFVLSFVDTSLAKYRDHYRTEEHDNEQTVRQTLQEEMRVITEDPALCHWQIIPHFGTGSWRTISSREASS